MPRRPSGEVRDAITRYLKARRGAPATIADIIAAVSTELGSVAPSSVRSYLQLGERGNRFERTGKGEYRLRA